MRSQANTGVNQSQSDAAKRASVLGDHLPVKKKGPPLSSLQYMPWASNQMFPTEAEVEHVDSTALNLMHKTPLDEHVQV